MASSSVYGTIADSEKNDFDKFMDDMNAIVGKDKYGGQSSSGSSSTSASTNSSKNSSGTTAIATNPNYDGIKDLAKLRTDTALKGQQARLDNDQYKFDRTLNFEKDKFQHSSFEETVARNIAKEQANKDRRSRERQADADRRLAWAAQNNQASARNKELALQSEKINAEITALHNANQWKGLEVMSTLAGSALDREFRKQQLEQQKQTAAWNTVGAIFS